MNVIFVLIALLVSLKVHAFPNKYQGFCQEVGSSKKSAAKIGLEFKDFPKSLSIIDENGKITTAHFESPTRMSPGVDQYVVLENIATSAPSKFSLMYYGSVYTTSRPYFFEMTVSYDLTPEGQLKTHQLQTTYYQGQVSLGNEWNCEYQQY